MRLPDSSTIVPLPPDTTSCLEIMRALCLWLAHFSGYQCELSTDPSVLKFFVYILSCVNVGPSQVSITNYHWRYRKYPFTKKLNFWTFPYLDNRVSHVCSKLPKQLSDGEQVLIFHPLDFFAELEQREEFLFAENALTAFYRIMTFNLYVDTSIGKPVKVKVS